MDEYRTHGSNRLEERRMDSNSDEGIQFLPSAEEQLLQSISAHAPLPEVLNKICATLDCRIGDVVSLISLPGNDASKRVGIALSAVRFGLHIFCSESIVADEELLGFLEMYCCIPRNPSASEFQWIERAKYLAALAIKRGMEAGDQRGRAVPHNRPARGRLLDRLVFTRD
jgi:hypothetical protein